MTKNVKGILTVVVVGAVAAAVYLHFNKSKLSNARTIVQLGGSTSLPGLMVMDEAYLQAWAKALGKGLDTFQYQEKSYHTAGGKAVVV